jgi:hypothetical protein
LGFYFSHRDPSFELKGLEPGIGYDIVLIARNKKGTSNPTQLQAYTLKNAEKQTGTEINSLETKL